jgi:hypothetical protein
VIKLGCTDEKSSYGHVAGVGDTEIPRENLEFRENTEEDNKA